MAKDRRKKVTPEMKERMKELRSEGLSYRETAEKLGLSYATVYNHLKRSEEEEEEVAFQRELKRKIAPISIAAAVLIGAIAGYYLLTGREVSGIKYETYRNENYSFKFDYPADWVFSEHQYAFGAVENTSDNVGGGSVMLLVFPVVAGISLDNVYDSLMSYAENNENFTIISGPTDVTIDNTPAFEFSATSSAKNITTQVEWMISIRNNLLYYFSMGVKKEKYPSYEQIFEHVIDSFSFLD